MGVPKFFRWLSERYPRIIQRHGSPASPETCELHERATMAAGSVPEPDPLSCCGLPPQIDRLYIDMNGLIHGCSHNNEDQDVGAGSSSEHVMTEEKMFANLCFYLDRIVRDVAQPRELLYLSVDGVAPRAKLNQQRSRRYRSGQQGEIEKTVYEAHEEHLAAEQRRRQQEQDLDDGDDNYELWHDNTRERLGSASIASKAISSNASSKLVEVEPGRFAGKFETTTEIETPPSTAPDAFHSNLITPGTAFFQRCTEHLIYFIKHKLTHDSSWQHLQVVFSGPDVPGEGEHKIMQFVREQRMLPNYNANLRHCIMGQDGDWIMLGLASHEPNLMLLREPVVFDIRRRRAEKKSHVSSTDQYIYNGCFEFLHMNTLRDYLALDFGCSNIMEESPFDLERTIDDFVFMTFFVGNDFLPHLPALDIADEAFDLLFYTYRQLREDWIKDKSMDPYLTHAGTILSGRRLQEFLQLVGSHETMYFNYKHRTVDLDQVRKSEAKWGSVTTPSDQVLHSKEVADREKYRELVQRNFPSDDHQSSAFAPVMSASVARINGVSSKGRARDDDKGPGRERMSNLLKYSVPTADGGSHMDTIDDRDLKGRYYADKFGFSPFDQAAHLALRETYIEGLVWTLKYYYEGCVSWSWYYKYHYGPMLSDLVGLDDILGKVSFRDLGKPLSPFEQLMACMPPSQAHVLPEPYRWLLTDKKSPISDFYPAEFTIDMNGKRWPWEAVVLLPFIDADRLLEASRSVDCSALPLEERKRSETGSAIVLTYDTTSEAEQLSCIGVGPFFGHDLSASTRTETFADSKWHYKRSEKPVLLPRLAAGVEIPLPGLPTLFDGNIESMWRKLVKINVHGVISRYRTAVLELCSPLSEALPLGVLAEQFIGSTMYIDYPCLKEGYVTAVSNSQVEHRGNSEIHSWDRHEQAARKRQLQRVLKGFLFGERRTGTGGITLAKSGASLEDLEILLNVRPLESVKVMPNGTRVKTYGRFEIEVPLFTTAWFPAQVDERLRDLPALLEKDPYHAATRVLTHISSPPVPTNAAKQTGLKSVARVPAAVLTSPLDVSKKMQARQCSTWQASPLGTMGGLQSIVTADKGPRLRGASSGCCRRQSPRTPNVPSMWRASRAGLALTVAACVFSWTQAASTWSLPTPANHFSSFAAETATEPRHHDGAASMSYYGVPAPRRAPPLAFAHGTTTLSFIFDDGIVCAVDSRASLGSFVGSKTTHKVLPIHSHCLGTMAGGAADCMYWIRKLKAQAALHELTEQCRMTVTHASRWLANALYANRVLQLSIGTMIMGFDNDQPHIFYVDNTGCRLAGDLFAVGSGSTYALSILDQERRHNMTTDEAVALGIKAIRHATYRDAYSGGYINVYLITPLDGWQHVFTEDVAASKVPK